MAPQPPQRAHYAHHTPYLDGALALRADAMRVAFALVLALQAGAVLAFALNRAQPERALKK